MRQMPQSLEAERALLGSILLDNRGFYNVSDFLQSHHFFDEVNGLIFMGIQSLIRENKQANAVTLKTALDGYSLLEDAGGMKYLAALSSGMITTINVSQYGRSIHDLWQRRQIIETAAQLLETAFAPPDVDMSPRTMVEQHDEKMLKIMGSETTERGLVSFADVLTMTQDEWDHQSKGAHGVPTGYPDVDKLIGGLHATDLIIIGGRSSMGKTAFATALAFNAAMFFRSSEDIEYKGRQVAFFSLEMSAEQLGSRIITGQTRIQAPRNRWGQQMSSDEWGRVQAMAMEYGTLPFWIDDSAELTISRIRARCVRLHRRKPIGLIVIDYLQLISGEARASRDEKRIEQISAITRGLKRLAKDMKVPVIALSQLSRAPENRDEKRPVLGDLRESGTIENDADVVIFPFRPEYYLKMGGEPQRKGSETTETYANRLTLYHQALAGAENLCEIIVAKQRHGPLGSANLYFDGSRTWFESMSQRDVPREEAQPSMDLK